MEEERIVYVNGAFVRETEARISVFDRGFLFADGIYEVSAVLDGKLVDNVNHMERLERSLREIRMANPHSREQWVELQKELVRRNNLVNGLVYMEVTRGAADRDFHFPPAGTPATVVMFTQAFEYEHTAKTASGVTVVTVADLRWARRDIKTINLLAQVLAKQHALEAGADEVWMVQDGFVTEGGSSSSFIVTKAGSIVTRPLSHSILPSITRKALLKLAQEQKLAVEERLFTVEEAQKAVEAFMASATSIALSVVSIDGKPVGDGKPGPLAARLRELYFDMARA
ncbi:MAG: D-amino-acid transaminase [Methylobacteriaceae bacterium]|jgi:D-alanine transaminase|nr:D-amino-acid transaminase [Methylobacteriaceae bacterium]